MAVPSLATSRTNIRRRVNDTDTTVSPGLSDASYTALYNQAYYWWYENMEKRLDFVNVRASWTSGIATFASDAAAIQPEYHSLLWNNSRVLERMEWNEVLELQRLFPTNATPQAIALQKQTGGAGTSENRWFLALWPIPNATAAVEAYTRIYPTALSADADTPDLGDFEALCVENIAAYWAATLLDYPDLAQMALQMLPQLAQSKLTAERKRLDPLRRPEEDAA